MHISSRKYDSYLTKNLVDSLVVKLVESRIKKNKLSFLILSFVFSACFANASIKSICADQFKAAFASFEQKFLRSEIKTHTIHPLESEFTLNTSQALSYHWQDLNWRMHNQYFQPRARSLKFHQYVDADWLREKKIEKLQEFKSRMLNQYFTGIKVISPLLHASLAQDVSVLDQVKRILHSSNQMLALSNSEGGAYYHKIAYYVQARVFDLLIAKTRDPTSFESLDSLIYIIDFFVEMKNKNIANQTSLEFYAHVFSNPRHISILKQLGKWQSSIRLDSSASVYKQEQLLNLFQRIDNLAHILLNLDAPLAEKVFIKFLKAFDYQKYFTESESADPEDKLNFRNANYEAQSKLFEAILYANILQNKKWLRHEERVKDFLPDSKIRETAILFSYVYSHSKTDLMRTELMSLEWYKSSSAENKAAIYILFQNFYHHIEYTSKLKSRILLENTFRYMLKKIELMDCILFTKDSICATASTYARQITLNLKYYKHFHDFIYFGSSDFFDASIVNLVHEINHLISIHEYRIVLKHPLLNNFFEEYRAYMTEAYIRGPSEFTKRAAASVFARLIHDENYPFILRLWSEQDYLLSNFLHELGFTASTSEIKKWSYDELYDYIEKNISATEMAPDYGWYHWYLNEQPSKFFLKDHRYKY